MELPVKKVPATAAVIKPTSVAATSALNPSRDRSRYRLGASAPTPQIKMASEATWAKPQMA